MNERFNSFNELISNASNYLETQLKYSLRTVDGYRGDWKQIRNYMISNHIISYNKDVGKMVLLYKFQDRSIAGFSVKEKHLYNSIIMLTEFQESGKINKPSPPRKKHIVFDGPLGEAIIRFLNYNRIEKRLSIIRINCYQLNLNRFFNYCNKNSIYSIKDIHLAVILHFISELYYRKDIPVYSVISTLRGFMKYAFEQNLLSIDFSAKIPRYKSVIQPKLPSTYTKNEIEKLISSVERRSSIEKRNYAIILIISRLGLRASDISALKFKHLHWDTCLIKIEQFKTGKELVLPMLPDVGNAVIDYLTYGRPISDEPYVFLSQRPPYGRFLTSNVVTHVVQRAFIKAGININDRRFGPHSLRHSLGFRMLEESTVLPVISEIFGHESTESTRYYLRIDVKSMRQCMLEVSPVSTDFYEQKGGLFYA